MSQNEASQHPRDIMGSHGLSPTRHLGQNFLVSGALMDRIVSRAGVDSATAVLEIGTGLGRLTERLCRAAGAVVSVEIDRGLRKVAADRLREYGNLALLHEDFLESKHSINARVTAALGKAGRGRAVRVVSNLPYAISSPAIINMLEWEIDIERMDVMLQQEVADRLMASPGTDRYGPLTVYAGYHAEVEKTMDVDRSAFWPQPKVASAVVAIHPRETECRVESYDTFVRVVRRLFQSRRKTLYRALSVGWDKTTARRVLDRLGREGRIRPGKLSVTEYAEIARAVARIRGIQDNESSEGLFERETDV
ncbi:MAG: 16S rRNA (adenine(1518)-N(6)/adenine(1519)-N(6))-dimethyltransferase RsmA [Planctomycetota bacterium]